MLECIPNNTEENNVCGRQFLCNTLKTYAEKVLRLFFFFSLWVAECPSGLREAHSLLHTCDVYLYVGRKARNPSVISVGEVWSRR